MTTKDPGSGKAIAGSVLQLAGGLLIGSGSYFGYLDGMRNPWSLGLGVLASAYFIVSGAIRFGLGVLTRRAR